MSPLPEAPLCGVMVVLEVNGFQTDSDLAVDIREELPEDMRNNRKIHYHKCDVTDRQAVMDMARQIEREHGEVSILLNNAGVSTWCLRLVPAAVGVADFATLGRLRALHHRCDREGSEQSLWCEHYQPLLYAAGFLTEHDQEQERSCRGYSVDGIIR